MPAMKVPSNSRQHTPLGMRPSFCTSSRTPARRISWTAIGAWCVARGLLSSSALASRIVMLIPCFESRIPRSNPAGPAPTMMIWCIVSGIQLKWNSADKHSLFSFPRPFWRDWAFKPISLFTQNIKVGMQLDRDTTRIMSKWWTSMISNLTPWITISKLCHRKSWKLTLPAHTPARLWTFQLLGSSSGGFPVLW